MDGLFADRGSCRLDSGQLASRLTASSPMSHAVRYRLTSSARSPIIREYYGSREHKRHIQPHILPDTNIHPDNPGSGALRRTPGHSGALQHHGTRGSPQRARSARERSARERGQGRRRPAQAPSAACRPVTGQSRPGPPRPQREARLETPQAQPSTADLRDRPEVTGGPIPWR